MHEQRGSGVVSSLQFDLAEIAAATGNLRERSESFLGALRAHLPCDAAWMALTDVQHPHYTTAASTDLDESVREYLEGPVTAADIEATGTNGKRPPLSPSDLPYPRTELRTWAECLVPGGINEALAVALFEPGGRHVGFLALLYGARQPPSSELRAELARATSIIGHGVDPLRGLVSAARLVADATSGVALRADGRAEPVPGLDLDPLLRAADLLELAHAQLGGGHTYTSFLWPSHPGQPIRHQRVTVIAATTSTTTAYVGLVLLSPGSRLRGLTARELEVLGYVVDGCTNQEISHRLVLSPRTVAAHLEHILVKLDAPSRTLAAVRAFRDGLYVPVAAQRRSPSR
jgi:DNA-binding CsgD family transcriptional regulator